ncbi:MAG: hypothetical protein V7782_05805 [Psychromonas sp.]
MAKSNKPDADAIAKELSNPATSLSSLNFNFETYTGEEGFMKQKINFQPSFPIKLDEGAVFAIRPLVGMTITDKGDEKETSFDNISTDIMYGQTFKSGTILLGGVYFSAPTSTADGAQDNWVGGPEALIAQIFPWGVAGTFVSHATDFNSPDSKEFETDLTNIQYIYSVGLGGGYTLSASPTIVYNLNYEDQKTYASGHNLESEWSIPVGIGISKTTIIGNMPLKISAEVNYYVEKQRESDADFLLKFKITPVVKNPLQSFFN